VERRPPWSSRRRRLLLGLATGAVVFGAGLFVLPARFGIPSGFLAALCAFLMIAATVVFLAIPGPGTLQTLLRTVPLAGAVLVVAVLLVLSTSAGQQRLWAAVAAAAAAWTAYAVWQTRRSGS
jgi:hypothetical protein